MMRISSINSFLPPGADAASSFSDEMNALDKKAREMKRKAAAAARKDDHGPGTGNNKNNNKEHFSGSIVHAAPPAGANNFAPANFN